ncbi:hypothetical protein KO488_06305 [Poseidonibacter lekithochrous]|uniref:hypothetical protein n=1 Tax=Poseidonibacter TaxID=2321187 RepID=UPI001C0848CE|nr:MULTISPECIES: hypothetical protein [Poseidonibacter]MBU3014363.1 hypothetical protein [Poseidonibacter lekithochrous]MDO6827661.1 hypothetical protein [Poseidonibacter sp. 1_MG-2023]
MPQLIAMVIVVVGAMIYMFQTFGGTGDKIEGIAQKSSIITEINNIKSGVQLALRSEVVYNTSETESVENSLATSLSGIASLEFFPEQINNQLIDNAVTNTYNAISFGASDNMEITLVLPSTDAAADESARPGLFIDMSKGNLATNSGFLEKQVINDLESLASIDEHAISTTGYNALDNDGDITAKTAASTGSDLDGMFTIYFKDLPRGSIRSE